MKKILAAVLIIGLMAFCAGCGSGSESSTDTGSGSEEVTVTIPANVINIMGSDEDNHEMSQSFCDNLKTFDGIESAEVNSDDSATIVMTADAQQHLLESYKSLLDAMAGSGEDGNSYSYISSIDYDDELREIDVAVDAEGYVNSSDTVSVKYATGIYVMYYQYFAGYDDIYYTINITDESSGEVIDTFSTNSEEDK